MNKRLIIGLLVLAIGLGGCKAGDGKTLSGDYIHTYKWEGNDTECTDVLEFSKDGTFKLVEDPMINGYVSDGTYQVDGNTVKIDITWHQLQTRHEGTIDGKKITFGGSGAPFYDITFTKK